MKIGIDCDDVIANFVQEMLKDRNEKIGTDHKYEDVVTYDLSSCLGTTPEYMTEYLRTLGTTGFFKELPQIADSRMYMNRMKLAGHDLYIITSRSCAKDTIDWLDEQKYSYDNVFLTPRKHEVSKALGLDFMIEDNPRHIKDISEQGVHVIVPNHPWNALVKESEYVTKVNDWETINSIIKREDSMRKLDIQYDGTNAEDFLKYRRFKV